MQNKTLFMVEVAVFAALALLLDLVSGFIFSRIWPQGGSVSIAMVPIFLMAYRWGVKGGVVTGLLLGLLQIVIGNPVIAHPVQGFLDYFLAFSLVGISGIFMNKVVTSYKDGHTGKGKMYGIAGILLGSFLRFLCHFTSGIVFFASYTPKGQNVAVYSLVYNGTYMLASFILSAIIVVLLYSGASKVLIKKSFQA
ncbi:energy-coupled thiamine transporter ThiT [Bacillus sp. MUM 13]|uniref:energy-coupled thiamine transporter ThiT n=1 Tax=Bacillus sp. MUM 13 TaxID=1678001 RepID=UPI0008F5C585|nr:energy-coupled thiamine transporter ThiT [Bacillus sp. MUM 13]OIK08672.1 energy-coupled thiamine transporter ThiT [Bacillus sp. MUM 13]